MKKFVALTLVAFLTVSCASNLAKPVVEADTRAVTALLDVKTAKDARCDANQLPATTCQALAAAFVPLWDAYLAANALAASEAPVEQLDAAIAEFRKAAFAFQDVVFTIQGNARQILLDLLAQALRRFDR